MKVLSRHLDSAHILQILLAYSLFHIHTYCKYLLWMNFHLFQVLLLVIKMLHSGKCTLSVLFISQAVTTHHSNTHLANLLFSMGTTPCDAPPMGPVSECFTVFLDGKILGYIHQDIAQNVEKRLRFLKVKGLNKVRVKMRL